MNWKVQRLVNEWIKHGAIIIALDFDDTIFPYSFAETEHNSIIARTRNTVKAAIEVGSRVVIYTSSAPTRYGAIRDYCDKHGIKVEAINENLPGLEFGSNVKPYANIYLDDRAGLEEALDTLDTAIVIVAAEKGSTTH